MRPGHVMILPASFAAFLVGVQSKRMEPHGARVVSHHPQVEIIELKRHRKLHEHLRNKQADIVKKTYVLYSVYMYVTTVVLTVCEIIA